ncbi:phage major capsid protein [Hyphococcus flavus]|uniref:Phage major capsid protein n=1 Tax=Hyphococcus flavus TaxID=1866326 RepID=A0AAF0CHQ0_9PROT|nr:phage major capsid protein [Hyphococcus flavus]WDI32157.1 phage major capsid protein [Hyphococcus flavus]
MSIETKAGNANSEVRGAMRDFLNAFEQFKDANDERLSALEKKQQDDVVLAEKVDRINEAVTEQKAAVDRIALNNQRPQLSSGLNGSKIAVPDERKAAFLRYMRVGDATAAASLEAKAAAVSGTGEEGGYLAPHEVERIITAAVKDISPIRQIASVREIGGNVFRKPVSNGDGAAGWVAETTARDTATTSPTLTAIDFPTMELYAMPAASQTLLDDSIVDIEQWLADEVQTEFAVQESAAFISGNGTTAPKGLLTYDIAADASKDPDELGYIATGADGAFPASNPSDVLLDLIYAPKQAYRANGRFLMNRSVVGALRKFKDSEGNYLWQPNNEPGEPARLMGYPVTEAEDMDDIASDSHSIAFGDFRRGYLIVDRVGVRVLRDPYSAKPYVLFYTTKRVGGGVQDFDAIKFLKFAAS